MAQSIINGVDYGPLARLIGTWSGDTGMDVSPEPDDSEHSPYYETIVFTAADDVDNAESQELAVVHYHQVVSRQSNDKVFHNESGYWLWDKERQLVMQSLAIPRGVALVAGGQYKETADGVELTVRAAQDDADWPVSQSPFMRDHARTLTFDRRLTLSNDRISYQQTTLLSIYGRRFEHTDANVLTRTAG